MGFLSRQASAFSQHHTTTSSALNLNDPVRQLTLQLEEGRISRCTSEIKNVRPVKRTIAQSEQQVSLVRRLIALTKVDIIQAGHKEHDGPLRPRVNTETSSYPSSKAIHEGPGTFRSTTYSMRLFVQTAHQVDADSARSTTNPNEQDFVSPFHLQTC